MQSHLYLVDFPTSKLKMWQKYLPDLPSQAISMADLWKSPTADAANFYLFYVSGTDHYKEIQEQVGKKNKEDTLGFIFKDAKSLQECASIKVLDRSDVFLMSIDDPGLNLGSLSTIKHTTALKNQEVKLGGKFKNKVQELSTQFDVAIERLEKQLMLARQKFFAKDHGKTIKFKNVNFDYVYRVGNKPGTEYSDFIFWNRWILWINFSSSDYAVSSVLLKFIEDCRQEKDDWQKPNLATIFELFNHTIKNFQKVMSSSIEADFFMCLIDSQTHNAEFIHHGGYECYSDKRQLWPQKEKVIQSIHLEKGEKFLLMTPGTLKNIFNDSKKAALRQFIKEKLSLLKNEILTEIVLLLENDQSSFLDYDMNVVYGEISANDVG